MLTEQVGELDHRADAGPNAHRGRVVRKTHDDSSPTAASSSTSTRRDRDDDRPHDVVDPRDLARRRPPRRSATTRCSTSGWRSPRTARAAPTCRRRTSARCARPATAGTPSPGRDYDVVVFENRFPSFAEDADPGFVEDGERRAGRGRCEVVCFTSDHDTALSQLPPERVRLVLDAWVDRTEALAALPSVEQVFCFENRGEEIGVTLGHPHGQIYGYPFVTPRTRTMLESARHYHERTGGDLFADRAGRRAGRRLAGRDEQRALGRLRAVRGPLAGGGAPLPQRPGCPTCPHSDADARDDFPADLPRRAAARWTASTTRRCRTSRPGTRRRCGSTATSPPCTSRCSRSSGPPNKLKFLAGSESGMGAFVNDIAPERAAAMLRDALPR